MRFTYTAGKTVYFFYLFFLRRHLSAFLCMIIFRPEFEGPKGRANSCVSLTPRGKTVYFFYLFFLRRHLSAFLCMIIFRPEFEGPKGRANSCVSLTPRGKSTIFLQNSLLSPDHIKNPARLCGILRFRYTFGQGFSKFHMIKEFMAFP